MAGPDTGADPGRPEEAAEPSSPDAPSATRALEELHGLLVDAGRGRAQPAEVRAAVESFWGDHRDTLLTAASTLTEQVRLQTLQELYRWRAQLAAQTDARSSSLPDSESGTTDPPG